MNCVVVVLKIICYIILYIGMQEVGSYRPAVRPERRRAMQREIIATAPPGLAALGQLPQSQR